MGIEAGIIQAENVIHGNQYNYYINKSIWEAIYEEPLYLKTLVEKCDYLELSTIDESSTTDDALRVSDVFVSVKLCESGENALKAIGESKNLVVLGLPGCGKSTIVNYLCTQLALKRLPKSTQLELQKVPVPNLPGFKNDKIPIPIRIILRDFASWININNIDDDGEAGLVWDYIYYIMNKWGCKLYHHIRTLIQNEGCVIFFDGLDEVRENDENSKRSIITKAIRNFAKPLVDKCKVVVTCREYAYKTTDIWRLPASEFPVVKLALFDMDQIKTFTQVWYQAKGAQKDWDTINQIHEANKFYGDIQEMFKYLKDIAQYPLLLTLMAQLHIKFGKLPKNRADLYERTVNLLLEYWDNRIIIGENNKYERKSGLIYRLGIKREILRSVLESLAYSAHERQEEEQNRSEECATISKIDLLDALKKELYSYDTSNKVIEYIQERAGLLTAQDNKTYTFPHRTFQEYLTATHLMQQSDFDTLLAERVRRNMAWWREVFLLAASSPHTIPSNISDIIYSLTPYESHCNGINADEYNYILLAIEIINNTNFYWHVEKERMKKERFEGISEDGKFSKTYNIFNDWIKRFLGLSRCLSAQERTDFGRELAILGDPRKEITTLNNMEFCLIPSFYKKEHDLGHTCIEIDYNNNYWLSRYLITNAQFNEFVKANGYQEKQYWELARKEGYWSSEGFKGKFDNEPRNRPHDVPYPFNLVNHPVVGITWYEALAFTKWLTEFFRKTGFLSSEWQIRLPSEAEWEKAAKGENIIPNSPIYVQSRRNAWMFTKNFDFKDNPGRVYPWGDSLDKEKANFKDCGIGTTSAVGCFLAGESPYGCLDMAGNVWGEWIGRSGKSHCAPFKVVLRGGSYEDDWSCLSCSYRFTKHPHKWSQNIGFRCACVPNFDNKRMWILNK